MIAASGCTAHSVNSQATRHSAITHEQGERGGSYAPRSAAEPAGRHTAAGTSGECGEPVGGAGPRPASLTSPASPPRCRCPSAWPRRRAAALAGGYQSRKVRRLGRAPLGCNPPPLAACRQPRSNRQLSRLRCRRTGGAMGADSEPLCKHQCLGAEGVQAHHAGCARLAAWPPACRRRVHLQRCSIQ